jgi:hypothetical protein
MKQLKVLTALSLAVLASTSGMVQVGAVDYNFNVDFTTKIVPDYDDFRQSFSTDTYNLDTKGVFKWGGTYSFDSCPTAFTANVTWVVRSRPNNTGTTYTLANETLPDLPCTTVDTAFSAISTMNLNEETILMIINDDADFTRFTSRIQIASNAALSGRSLILKNYYVSFDIEYDFNTTYLFNYFLSDAGFISRETGGWGSTILGATANHRLRYVYTTAGNDTYYINNSSSVSTGSNRKKYAVDYNEEFFRGASIGAGFQSDLTGSSDIFNFAALPTTVGINFNYDYYYLNAANIAQAIVDAPLINFTEETCSGGFLDINVACYVNNAIAYLVNDAPVISDAFTLLNTGIELAAQTFGIIGSFSDDNVFGYLILVGFGFIAVKWFLKNDE